MLAVIMNLSNFSEPAPMAQLPPPCISQRVKKLQLSRWKEFLKTKWTAKEFLEKFTYLSNLKTDM